MPQCTSLASFLTSIMLTLDTTHPCFYWTLQPTHPSKKNQSTPSESWAKDESHLIVKPASHIPSLAKLSEDGEIKYQSLYGEFCQIRTLQLTSTLFPY